jgi:hypothetical protein
MGNSGDTRWVVTEHAAGGSEASLPPKSTQGTVDRKRKLRVNNLVAVEKWCQFIFCP